MIVVMCAAAAGGSACARKAALTELMEARQLASELHVQFTKGSEAANRAVMADTDEASAAAADEARRATQTVEQTIETLRGTLQSLGYASDVQLVDAFDKRFAEYRQLDDEILPLAVENTNLKAQRLSFGPGREAAEAFGHALDRGGEERARGRADRGACADRRPGDPGPAGAAHRRVRRRRDDTDGSANV